ncbi:MAG: 7-cyano-7-deazaguanine synthase QueC [Fimbriiglobus sp.]
MATSRSVGRTVRESMPNAVVLLSGGLDSTTTLAVARSQGYEVFALSVDYGQRHRQELLGASQSAARFGVSDHRTVTLDLRAIGGSALTSLTAVPKGRSVEEMNAAVPVTYVPARNTILLGLALGYAETVQAFDIFIGANALDYSGYPDCRPGFLEAFERLANVATKAGLEGTGQFRIHAPLLQLTKAEIIRRAAELGVNFAETWSCYDPSPVGTPCGQCDACQLRQAGFAETGLTDG